MAYALAQFDSLRPAKVTSNECAHFASFVTMRSSMLNDALFAALNLAIALLVRVKYISVFFAYLATIFSDDAIDLVICAIVIMFMFLLFWCICIACVVLTHYKCSNYFHNTNKINAIIFIIICKSRLWACRIRILRNVESGQIFCVLR